MFELSFETENFTWKFRNFLGKFFDLLLPNQIELFIMKIVITSSSAIPFIFFLNAQWAIRNFPHETSHSSINHQSSRLLPTFPQRVPFSLFTIKRFFFLNEDENGKGRKFDGRESFVLKENVKNCRAESREKFVEGLLTSISDSVELRRFSFLLLWLALELILLLLKFLWNFNFRFTVLKGLEEFFRGMIGMGLKVVWCGFMAEFSQKLYRNFKMFNLSCSSYQHHSTANFVATNDQQNICLLHRPNDR